MTSALFPRHAFVDLETTGLDPERDDVIEVGALFIEQGQPTKRISRLFRPSGPLPLAIRRITGLSDRQLADQPAFESFVPELRAALEGWTVVAHNAAFERSFLAELLADIQAPVLDSCELLHLLYPELESHSLEQVIRWAKVGDHCAHRALQDCEDTFGVVAHALERCVEDGRAEDVADVLSCFEGLESAGADPLVRLLRDLQAICRAQPAQLTLKPSSSFLEGRPGRRRANRPDRLPEDHPPFPVEEKEVEALLGPGGALERTEGGFESRPAQLALSKRVAKTLNEGGTVAIEAGTGTGKSLAYIAPSALFAARNGWKVAVAPHTKTLQDQLMEKDLPKLHRASDGAFGYALLKGQTNYLCRRRSLEATRAEPGMDREARAARAYLRAFLRRSPDGDLDRLSYWAKEHFPSLGPLLTACRSEAATTLGEKCPHFHRCYYHSAVAQAKDADVLVINQALAASWPARYPEVRHFVLDEAHELEDVLTSALTIEVSGAQLARLRERLLGRSGRRGVLTELRRQLEGEGGELEALRGLAEQLGAAEETLRAAVPAFCGVPEAPGELFGRRAEVKRFAQERPITEEARGSREWARVRACLEALGACLAALVEGLQHAGAALSAQAGLSRELAGAVAAAEEAGLAVATFAAETRPDQCRYASVRPDRGEWTLCAQPLDVAGPFAAAFTSRARSLVLASATLSTGPGQPWVLERLGIARPEQTLVRAGTSFDLAEQGLVVLVTDAPNPQDPTFADWAAERISGLAEFLGGRVLGLFASAHRLEEVGQRVVDRLEPSGIEVLRQWHGNGRAMVARQEQDAGTVLLGTKSFWQGVDIPGAGVGCVFIDKLPIEPAGRPIVAAREAQLGGGGAAFARYRLPRALLLLRQGVGRLIRSATDRGVVVIADPGNPSYRRQVLAALDGYRVEALPWARARVRIHQALSEMGLQRSAPPSTETHAAV